ncbi:MAG: dihydrofolate reductase [Alphaproteobacteria bacterium]|nr:dihydrofolate reductase [Alphaproteobacteria bacterium]
MTKIAVWCRHKDDNVIGIGPQIPWHVSSDFKRFKRITQGQNILAGETTYESFPNRTLPNRKIFVLTFNPEYEVSDKENHFVINDVNFFKEFQEDVYICGGASIYKLFMTHPSHKLNPEIVVESVFLGDLDPSLKGHKVHITDSVDAVNKKYIKVSKDYVQDNISTAIYIKRSAFVEQSVLKKIIQAIEEGMEE